MVSMQLERLQRDSEQLDNFIKRLSDQGNYELVEKVVAKKEFLDNHIRELTT